MRNNIFVCDFDGTITKEDAINSFLSTFAPEAWLEIEKKWETREIGTQEAMTTQFGLIKDLSSEVFHNFLYNVNIDEYFKDFVDFVRKNNSDVVIVSDGLDYFIDTILKNHSVEGIKTWTNHLEYSSGSIVNISFPHYNVACKKRSGTCKCEIVEKLKEKYNVVYIGDGVSDFCVADKADLLFAKKRLLKYCADNKIACEQYETFKEVIKSVKDRYNYR